jgi:hypothetical protein
VVTENEIAEIKGLKYASNLPIINKNQKKNQAKPPSAEEDKEKHKIGREAAEKIKKRAQDHLMQLADRREQELIKEQEAKRKDEKLKATLREVILARSKNTEPTKEEIKEEPEESSDDSEGQAAPRKTKKTDENALRRLSQAPKRWSAPVITDLAVFRKKNKLTERDKIFIVVGGYPDIRRALLNRSTNYLARLVRES